VSGRLFSLACQQVWLCRPDVVETYLQIIDREQTGDFEAVAKKRSRYLDNADAARKRDGVAIIEVLGPIVRRADFFTEVSGGASVESLARDFETALNDNKIKAIVLEMDSPGGEAGGINEFSQMVFDARGKKPIVAYVDGEAASAAYWIASAADEIIAEPTAILGSIGVVAKIANPDAKRATDVKFISSQSPNKQANPNTEAGAEQWQNLVDHMAEVFISAVARNRAVSEETVLNDFGAGGLLVGRRAVEAGLADRLGSFESTLDELAAGVWTPPKREAKRPGAQSEEKIMADSQDMGVIDRIKALLNGDKPAATTDPAKPAATTDDQQARIAALEADARKGREEAEKARQDAARAQADAIKARAEAFAEASISAGKALPAERATMIDRYICYAADDLAMPVAEGQPSRVDRYKADLEARKAHAMFAEQVPEKEAAAKAVATDKGGEAGGELTEARRKELLAHTSLGQTVLGSAS